MEGQDRFQKPAEEPCEEVLNDVSESITSSITEPENGFLNNGEISNDKKVEQPFQAERKFHNERWEKKAREGTNFFGRTRRTPFAVMYEEAERDLADFEKRQHDEFEAWQVNLKKVISAFKEKAENPEQPTKNIIVMLGGGMKAAYTGGQALALNELGITADTVDAVVGTSSGAVVAAAYVAGQEQVKKSLAMFTGPLSSQEFINPSIKRAWQKNVINLDVSEKLMTEGEYAFDQEKIRNAKPKLFLTVTEPLVNGEDDAKVRFLDAKDREETPSIPHHIRSSMTIPGLTGEVPLIDGQEYYDGAFNPLPIEEIIEKFNEDGKELNVLILPQTPFELMENIKPSAAEYNLASLMNATKRAKMGSKASLTQTEKLLLSREDLRESLERIQTEKHVNIGIMWPPDDGLETINTDADAATAAIIASARDTIEQFGGEQPEEIDLSPQEEKPDDFYRI